LYVIGGFTQSFFSVWSPVASVYAYDPAADSWTERAPMPTARGALAVAELDGKLFAIGGYDGKGNSAAVEVYDPASNSWRTLAPLPTPRDHLAVAVAGRRIFAIAGRLNRDYGQNLSVTESYDPAANQWTRVADLPTPRSGITAGVIQDIIYVVGGEAPQGTFRTNEAYLPDLDRWQTMPPMPTGRHGLGSAVVNGRLYVLSGGPTPGGSFSNVTEVFAPTTLRPATFRLSGQSEPARASRQQVRTIMALLSAFDDAGILPPESTPDADRLIKALIQSQAALMKAQHPAVQQLLTDALTARWGTAAPAELAAFHTGGWTSESLEAVLDYVEGRDWDAKWEEGLRPFNIGRQDFALLARTFRAARDRLAASGRDVHAVYAAKRRELL
jgi:N-acetylneuraminic acid mutarotase